RAGLQAPVPKRAALVDSRFGVNRCLIRLEAGVTAGLAALFQVALVVLLRRIKGRCRDDFGDAAPAVFRLLGLERRDGGCLLRWITEKDGRAILGAEIPALPVVGRWIVDPPEGIEQ